ETYTYDDLDRLATYNLSHPQGLRNAIPNIGRSYQYDDANNLVSINDTLNPFAQNPIESFVPGQPSFPRALNSISRNGATTSLAIDGRGRQTGRQTPVGATIVEWTSFNLPKLIQEPSRTTFFTHDPFGSRLRKNNSHGDETITLAGLFERRTSGADGSV